MNYLGHDNVVVKKWKYSINENRSFLGHQLTANTSSLRLMISSYTKILSLTWMTEGHEYKSSFVLVEKSPKNLNCVLKVKITVTPLKGSVLCFRGRGGLYFISHLYLESLWTATADGLWPSAEARLLQPISVKDILIFLSCQVDAPSCSGRHFSSFFQSLQHSVGGSSDCHRSSWKTWRTEEM